MNQTLIDDIVQNVLAKLQHSSVRPVNGSHPQTASVQTTPVQTSTVSKTASVDCAVATLPPPAAAETKPAAVELISPVITANLLEAAVRPGQALRIGRNSIVTPAARDWLASKKIAWTRQDKSQGISSAAAPGSKSRWRVVLQTVTPHLQALQEGLRRLSEGWKFELVGQPMEAAALATSLIGTAECDGVIVFSEYSEFIACKANRNERVRAAVMHNSKQWEQVTRTLSANVVCISPVGRTFVELRNLLRDCAAARPHKPAGF